MLTLLLLAWQDWTFGVFIIRFLNSVGVFQADEHIQVQDKSFSRKAVSALLPHGLSAALFIVAGGSNGNGPGHIHNEIFHKSKLYSKGSFFSESI